MFLDVKRSSDYLREHQAQYLFSEEANTQKESSKMDVE